MEKLNPMMDFVFKALFGKEDNESKMLLIELLNDILVPRGEDRIQDIRHQNPFNYKEFETDKLSVLDIKAKTDKDETINIEVQVKAEDNYRKRSLYYWSKAYAETIKEAESYRSLKKTIVINIMGYNAINESEKLQTTFKILEEDEHFILLDDLQIHYLELTKLPDKEVKDLEGVELWLTFLKEASKKDNESRIEELRERSKAMSTAINKLEEISADERMREIYRAREKSRLDMKSKIEYAEHMAMERGIEKSMEKIVRNAIKKGMQLEDIIELTDLTKEDIERISEQTQLVSK